MGYKYILTLFCPKAKNITSPPLSKTKMLPATDASNQMYTLRGNSKLDLHGSFRELRNNNKFSDISLSCRNTNGGSLSIRAHRVILSAYSRIFEDMFSNHPSTTDPMVYLKGVIFDDLKNLLDFMYNGEVSVPQSNLASFLAAAEDLQVRGLDNDSSDTSVFKTNSANTNPTSSQGKTTNKKEDLQKEEEASVARTNVKVKREPTNTMSYNKFMGREEEDEEDTEKDNAEVESKASSNKKRLQKSPQKRDMSPADMKRVRRSKLRQNYNESDDRDYIADYENINGKEDEIPPKKKTKVSFRTESSSENETKNAKAVPSKSPEFDDSGDDTESSKPSNKAIETIKQNDLVIATVKGRKPWPAKVTEVVSNGSYKVTFFETLNVNYTDKQVFSTKIVKYNNETKKVLEKDQSEKMKHAIRKIEAELKLQNA